MESSEDRIQAKLEGNGSVRTKPGTVNKAMTFEARYEERQRRKAREGQNNNSLRRSMPNGSVINGSNWTQTTPGDVSEPKTFDARFEERQRRRASEHQHSDSLHRSMRLGSDNANAGAIHESTTTTARREMLTSDTPRRQRVSRRSLLDDKLEQHKSSLTLESSASCGLDLLSHEDRKSSQGSANIEVSNGSEGGTANKDSLRESKTAQTPSTLTSSKNKYESWEDLEGVLEATLAMSISAINSDAQGK